MYTSSTAYRLENQNYSGKKSYGENGLFDEQIVYKNAYRLVLF